MIFKGKLLIWERRRREKRMFWFPKSRFLKVNCAFWARSRPEKNDGLSPEIATVNFRGYFGSKISKIFLHYFENLHYFADRPVCLPHQSRMRNLLTSVNALTPLGSFFFFCWFQNSGNLRSSFAAIAALHLFSPSLTDSYVPRQYLAKNMITYLTDLGALSLSDHIFVFR